MTQIATTLRPVETTNHAGFKAFVHGWRDQVRNFLRTGTLSGTFYVRKEKLAAEMVQTLVAFGVEDAVALAEETVSAREDGYMRTMPIVATAVLSGLPDKELFYRTARRVLRTPKDVAQFVEVCLSGAIPGRKSFGGCAVKPVREFLEGLSEYHALKGSQTKSVSLQDLVRMTHPRPDGEVRSELLGWLSGHVEGKNVRSNSRVAAFEELKRATDVARLVELIRVGGLPYEAVTAAVNRPDREVWVELLRVAPIFNLLRNLATFTRHGVFEESENVELAVAKLTRTEAIRRAGIFPHQVYAAWKVYSEMPEHDLRIVAALSDALDGSVATLPLFPGRVVIAPDVSGSMFMEVSEGSTTTASEVSGVLAAGLLRRCPNVRVLPFGWDVVPVSLNPRDSVLANARTIGQLNGGGTSLSAPVELLLRERDRVDLFVGLTDNEEWVGRGFLQAWREYKSKVAPAAKAVLVTIVPDPHRPVPESEPDVHFVHGWSDVVLRHIAEIGGATSEGREDPDETV